MVSVPALAATESGTLTVNATVTDACSVGDATLAFGDINTVAIGSNGQLGSTADVETSTSVDVVCTNGTTGTVTVGDGANADTSRRLFDGTSEYITYHLYSDSNRTSEITVDGGTATAYTVTGDGTNQTIDIYGSILADDLTNQGLGTYTDTVTLTITY
jgi:spore coat protein U-like protein